jgi:phosphoribosylformylglycinamidine synthase
MIHFFGNKDSKVFAVQTTKELAKTTISKLTWLFANQPKIEETSIDAFFVGPRAAMITPWSTNAVEITQNMGIDGIIRIEEFHASTEAFADFDPMISEKFNGLHQESFTINIEPETILNIADIAAYNQQEGLALNNEEIEYLEGVSKKLVVHLPILKYSVFHK